MHKQIKALVIAGVFTALSVALVVLIQFPIFPAVSFLRYDPADVPIFLVTMILGPWYGLGMTVIASVIEGMTVVAQDGIVGIIMHILATGSFVLVMGLLSRRFTRKQDTLPAPRRIRGMLIATIAGILTMIVFMALWNLIVTPAYLGISYEVLFTLYPWIVLFNVVKAGVNGLLALFLCEATRTVWRRTLR